MSWLQPVPTDQQMVEHLRLSQPEVFALARRLAPALRIEPRLLRNARMAYFPDTDAGLEAAFWYCPVVESRSRGGLTLKPGVARLLTDELAAHADEYAESLRLIEANTAHWPPHERLEQSLRIDARNVDTPPDILRDKIRRVLREIVQRASPAERADIARWAKGALPDIAPAGHALLELSWLAQFTTATLGDPAGALARQYRGGEPLPGWLAEKAPPTRQTYALGLRWRPGVLECLPAGAGEHVLTLGTPFPAPAFIRCDDDTGPGRWEPLWPERRVAVPLECRSLIIQPLTGPAQRLSLRTASTAEPGKAGFRRESARLILSYVDADREQAHSMAVWLQDQGLEVKPVPASKVAGDPELEHGTTRILHLWTQAALRDWSARTDEQRATVQPSLLLRVEPVDLPVDDERGSEVAALDWTGWQESAGSPEAAAHLIDELTRWLDEKPQEPLREELAAAEFAEGMYRTTTKVNIRQGPGAQFELHPAGPLPAGTLVTARRRRGDWRPVQVQAVTEAAPAIEGWVNARYLEPVDQEPAPDEYLEVLSHGSVLVCDHQGQVILPPGEGPLTERHLIGATIVGCPNIGPSTKPCTAVRTPSHGLSEQPAPDGSHYLLPGVTGLTDGTPPNTVRYRAKDPVLIRVPLQEPAEDGTEPVPNRRDHADEVSATAKKTAERSGTFRAAPPPWPREYAYLESEILDPSTPPERRFAIGDELVRRGDSRKGVGLDARGLPVIDWVEITGGGFLYGEERMPRDLPTFYIARYPITNAQYQAFIDAGGYREERWWEGLQRLEAPEDPGWGEPNGPRETVSWYEAMAFCRWLSESLGYEIRLPTEEEWEKAARGSDGRIYPWGEDYRAGFANVYDTIAKAGPTNLKQTTAVGLYPQGASPYGVLDLSGNVCEWCLSESDHPGQVDLDSDAIRVLRGGSFLLPPSSARASNREMYLPIGRLDGGFRVACRSHVPR